MFQNGFNYVVLQPTTLCNINCAYCYLPSRKQSSYMDAQIPVKLAEAIQEQEKDYPVVVLWHGGEPLATGYSRFEKLLEPFEDLRKNGKIIHNVQTNGTLINEKWCDLFKKYEFTIGVSIDGPRESNVLRVDWSGKETFDRVLKGIKYLRDSNIKFSILAVANEYNLKRPEEFYRFFVENNISRVGINVEEREGINTERDLVDSILVKDFWKRLIAEWQKNPVVEIREIKKCLEYFLRVINNGSVDWLKRKSNPFPTITWDGNVVFISPELSATKSEKYNDFIAGNIYETPFHQIIKEGRNLQYVKDFVNSCVKCSESCSYFSLCGGGYPSNKYSEHGTTEATETAQCRNMNQRLLDAFIEIAEIETVK